MGSEVTEFYNVHSIIGKRMINGKAQYLIYWQNYKLYESTWEPKNSLNYISDLVKKFDQICKSKELPFILPTYQWDIVRKNHYFKKYNGELLTKKTQKQIKKERKNQIINLQTQQSVGNKSQLQITYFSDFRRPSKSIKFTKKSKSPIKSSQKSQENLSKKPYNTRRSTERSKQTEQSQQTPKILQLKAKKSQSSFSRKKQQIQPKNFKNTNVGETNNKCKKEPKTKNCQNQNRSNPKIEKMTNQKIKELQQNELVKEKENILSKESFPIQANISFAKTQPKVINIKDKQTGSQKQNEQPLKVLQEAKLQQIEPSKQEENKKSILQRLLQPPFRMKHFPSQIREISLYKRVQGPSMFQHQNIYQIEYMNGFLKWMKFDELYKQHSKQFIEFIEYFVK